MGQTILAVENERMVLRMLRRVLHAARYALVQGVSGEKALEAVAEPPLGRAPR